MAVEGCPRSDSVAARPAPRRDASAAASSPLTRSDRLAVAGSGGRAYAPTPPFARCRIPPRPLRQRARGIPLEAGSILSASAVEWLVRQGVPGIGTVDPQSEEGRYFNVGSFATIKQRSC